MDGIVIGLETHVQLSTRTKLFCGCKNPVTIPPDREPAPNSLVCETCLGMPGSKPRTNRAAIEQALRVALALNCEIEQEFFFSRKTYFYPDMSKNYQITQYEVPLARNGWIEIGERENKKRIRIARIHLEEDPARLVHIGSLEGRYTLVDYNRAGTPLIEIVTMPDLSSPEEAREYIEKLSQVLEYLGVYSPETGAVIKSDANISYKGNERVEIKNITGGKEVERALKYEAIRQKNLVENGEKIVRETRMWNPELGVTKSMRTKETEEDYGYIFEPDLPRVVLSRDYITKQKQEIPELPDEKRERFKKEYGIKEADVLKLTADRETADLFEHAVKEQGISVKTAVTWIGGVLRKTLNYHEVSYPGSGIRDEWMIKLMKKIESGEWTDHIGETVLREMFKQKRDPEEIAREMGLRKIESEDDVKQVVKTVLEEQKGAVHDYKRGEERALHYLVGQVMRKTRGQVDAKKARQVILELLQNGE